MKSTPKKNHPHFPPPVTSPTLVYPSWFPETAVAKWKDKKDGITRTLSGDLGAFRQLADMATVFDLVLDNCELEDFIIGNVITKSRRISAAFNKLTVAPDASACIELQQYFVPYNLIPEFPDGFVPKSTTHFRHNGNPTAKQPRLNILPKLVDYDGSGDEAGVGGWTGELNTTGNPDLTSCRVWNMPGVWFNFRFNRKMWWCDGGSNGMTAEQTTQIVTDMESNGIYGQHVYLYGCKPPLKSAEWIAAYLKKCLNPDNVPYGNIVSHGDLQLGEPV